MIDFSLPSIPERTEIGPALQASKWQQCPVLLDIDEMKDLIEELKNFWMVRTGGLISSGDEVISKAFFLEMYDLYITALKNGMIPDDSRFRSCFSCIWTGLIEAVYAVKIKPGYRLVKTELPVIQLQTHRFAYSTADQKFRSMVLGESIEWGIQFSFPSLYQDANFRVYTVKEGAQFPNAGLFKILQRRIRETTIATPFEVDGKLVNVPIRIGKQCLKWIHLHPQLSLKKIRVRV